MPLNCPPGQEPRYRWVTEGGKKIRLGFCGDKVVETKVKGRRAHKVKKK